MAEPEPPVEPQTTQYALQWFGAEQLPVQLANQFVAQLGIPVADSGPDGVFLIVGEAAPPVVLSPADEQLRSQAYGNVLPVRAHARYHLSRARLGELRDLLVLITEQYDAIHHQQRGQEGTDAGDAL